MQRYMYIQYVQMHLSLSIRRRKVDSGLRSNIDPFWLAQAMTTNRGASALRLGQHIEALWVDCNGCAWYEGKITALPSAGKSGTFAVRFEDGDSGTYTRAQLRRVAASVDIDPASAASAADVQSPTSDIPRPVPLMSSPTLHILCQEPPDV